MSTFNYFILEYDLPFFTNEHKILRKSVREFAEKNLTLFLKI